MGSVAKCHLTAVVFNKQRLLFTSFLTSNTEKRTASKKGFNESSGFMSDTSLKIVERESVKQLSATPLNSHTQAR